MLFVVNELSRRFGFLCRAADDENDDDVTSPRSPRSSPGTRYVETRRMKHSIRCSAPEGKKMKLQEKKK